MGEFRENNPPLRFVTDEFGDAVEDSKEIPTDDGDDGFFDAAAEVVDGGVFVIVPAIETPPEDVGELGS